MTRVVKAPDERRSELIASAKQLFYSRGYEDTAVSDIVAAVGVAKGTFYYYFDSKLAVLEAMADELLAHSQTLMHRIVADPALPALDKWNRALQLLADWKTEHKTELLAMFRLMSKSENLILRHNLQIRTTAVLAPELAQIIEQGVNEQVFQTDFVADSAAIVLAIFQSVRESIGNLLLHPEQYENPLAIAQNKYAAVQTAVERILGAPPGSLPLVDDATLNAWFADDAVLAIR